jgi:hypothetical protein
MENKQTAVEFLWEIIGNIKTNPDDALLIVQSFNQAKQMEKEQIIKAGNECQIYNDGWVYEDGEQYYNETYGSQAPQRLEEANEE